MAFLGGFPKRGAFGQQPSKDPRIALAEERKRRLARERELKKIDDLRLQRDKQDQLARAKLQQIERQQIQDRAKQLQRDKVVAESRSRQNALTQLIVRSNQRIKDIGGKPRETQIVREGGRILTREPSGTTTIRKSFSSKKKITAKDIIPRGGFKTQAQINEAVNKLRFLENRKIIKKKLKQKLLDKIEKGRDLVSSEFKEQQRLLALDKKPSKPVSMNQKRNFLEKFSDFINKRDKELALKSNIAYYNIEKKARARAKLNDIIINLQSRIPQLEPKLVTKARLKLNRLSLKALNKLITSGEKTFIGSIGFGKSIAQTAAKVTFLSVTPTGNKILKGVGKALGSQTTIGKGSAITDTFLNVAKTKDGREFAKELVSKTQLDELKRVYTDPNTYIAAGIGAAFVTASKLSTKGTVRTKTPKSGSKAAKALKNKVIVDPKSGKISIVNSKGNVIKVPKNLEPQFKKAIKQGSKVKPKVKAKPKPKGKGKTLRAEQLKKIAIKRARSQPKPKGKPLKAEQLKKIAIKKAKSNVITRKKTIRRTPKLRKPKTQKQINKELKKLKKDLEVSKKDIKSRQKLAKTRKQRRKLLEDSVKEANRKQDIVSKRISRFKKQLKSGIKDKKKGTRLEKRERQLLRRKTKAELKKLEFFKRKLGKSEEAFRKLFGEEKKVSKPIKTKGKSSAKIRREQRRKIVRQLEIDKQRAVLRREFNKINNDVSTIIKPKVTSKPKTKIKPKVTSKPKTKIKFEIKNKKNIIKKEGSFKTAKEIPKKQIRKNAKTELKKLEFFKRKLGKSEDAFRKLFGEEKKVSKPIKTKGKSSAKIRREQRRKIVRQLEIDKQRAVLRREFNKINNDVSKVSNIKTKLNIPKRLTLKQLNARVRNIKQKIRLREKQIKPRIKRKPKTEAQEINEFFDNQEASLKRITRTQKKLQKSRLKDAKQAGFDSIKELEQFQRANPKTQQSIAKKVLLRESKRRLFKGKQLTQGRIDARNKVISETIKDLKLGRIKPKVTRKAKAQVRRTQKITREQLRRIDNKIKALRAKERATIKVKDAQGTVTILKSKTKTQAKGKNIASSTAKFDPKRYDGFFSQGTIFVATETGGKAVSVIDLAKGKKGKSPLGKLKGSIATEFGKFRGGTGSFEGIGNATLGGLGKSLSSTRTEIKSKTRTKQKNDTKIKTLQKQKSKAKTKTATKTITKTIAALKTSTKTTTQQLQRLKLRQKQIQSTLQRLKLKQKLKIKPKTKKKQKPKKKVPPIPKLPKLKRKPKKRKPKKQSGFIGQARARGKKIGKRRFLKGKFVNVTKSTTKNKAIRSAAVVVDNTVSRSIRIVKGKKINKTKDIKRPSILSIFRKSKKNGNVLVEKSKYAINTRGEKQGITVRGLLARRRKARKDRIKRVISNKIRKTSKTTRKRKNKLKTSKRRSKRKR